MSLALLEPENVVQDNLFDPDAMGASLIQAQAMARRSDPKTTMIYFHNHERIKSGAERYVII